MKYFWLIESCVFFVLATVLAIKNDPGAGYAMAFCALLYAFAVDAKYKERTRK